MKEVIKASIVQNVVVRIETQLYVREVRKQEELDGEMMQLGTLSKWQMWAQNNPDCYPLYEDIKECLDEHIKETATDLDKLVE